MTDAWQPRDQGPDEPPRQRSAGTSPPRSGAAAGGARRAKSSSSTSSSRAGCGCLAAVVLIGAVVGIVFAVSHGGSHHATATATSSSTPTPSSTRQLTGAQRLLASAGPLGAHLVDTNHVICNTSTAYYLSDGHGGTVLQITLNGPAVVGALLTTHDHRGEATPSGSIDVGANGWQHDFVGVPVSDVNELDVNATKGQAAGTCQAAAAG